MRVSTLYFSAAALLAPLAVSAAPLQRSIDASSLEVLQFAFVLENFETQFYQHGLNQFQPSDYASAGFTGSSSQVVVEEITIIESDESEHVTIIEEIIVSFGETPLSSCQFDFSSVLVDVSTMMSFARVVENVGVGAYLGAAHLVNDPRVLSSAASILTIEARHQTMLNIFEGGSAIPQSFDMPLSPPEVLAIAGSFISGCDLGIKANPSLSVTNTGSIVVGTLLQFSSSAFSGSTSGFFCQMLVGGLPFSISLPIDQCIVPPGIDGPVAVWITSDDQPLNANVVDRQSNAIVAGPLMTFIDSESISIEVTTLVIVDNSSGSSGDNMCNGSSCPPSSSSSMMCNGSSCPPSSSSMMCNGSSCPPSSTSTSMMCNGSSCGSNTSTSMMSMATMMSNSTSTTTVSPAQASSILSAVAGMMTVPMPSMSASASSSANGLSVVPMPTMSM
jgi:hypothetical protein